MKKLLVCMFAVLSVNAFSQSDDALIEFAKKAGHITGTATACKLPIDQIQGFEGAVIKRSRSFGSDANPGAFTDSYNAAMRKAERQRDPKFVECMAAHTGIFYKSILGVEGSSPITQTNPDQQAVPVLKSLKYVASQGDHICHVEYGETKPVLGETSKGPVYGKPVQREFRVEGFTELVSGNRIKVLINAIRASTQAGFEYVTELQPTYTKGHYVWQESSGWALCD